MVEDHSVKLEQLEAAQSQPGKAEMLDHGLSAAQNAWSSEKLRLLAGIVAAGIVDTGPPDQTDRVHVLLSLVASLERIHIQALMAIGLPRSGTGQLAGSRVVGGISNDELHSRLPALSNIRDPVLGVLQSQGLVEDKQRTASITTGPLWIPTEFGFHLLEYLGQGPEAQR
jgi:hypothetical protein